MADTDELRRLLDEAIEEHAPWSMTEYGQLCQCGEPMRDEICLGMGRTEKGRKLTAATFAALPGLLNEQDERRAKLAAVKAEYQRMQNMVFGDDARGAWYVLDEIGRALGAVSPDTEGETDG